MLLRNTLFLLVFSTSFAFSDDDGRGHPLNTAAIGARTSTEPVGDNNTVASHLVVESIDSLRDDLENARNDGIRGWAASLMNSQYWWYQAANAAELLSQLCYVASPIIAGTSAAMDGDKNLALAASIVGGAGVGLGKFSKYAHMESGERGKAANQFLRAAGVNEIPVIYAADPMTAHRVQASG